MSQIPVPPNVSPGWSIADKYRNLLIVGGSTQAFNTLTDDVDKAIAETVNAERQAREAAEKDISELQIAARTWQQKAADYEAKLSGSESALSAAKAENAGLLAELAVLRKFAANVPKEAKEALALESPCKP